MFDKAGDSNARPGDFWQVSSSGWLIYCPGRSHRLYFLKINAQQCSFATFIFRCDVHLTFILVRFPSDLLSVILPPCPRCHSSEGRSAELTLLLVGEGGGRIGPTCGFSNLYQISACTKPFALAPWNLWSFPNHLLGVLCQKFYLLPCAEAAPGTFLWRYLSLNFEFSDIFYR